MKALSPQRGHWAWLPHHLHSGCRDMKMWQPNFTCKLTTHKDLADWKHIIFLFCVLIEGELWWRRSGSLHYSCSLQWFGIFPVHLRKQARPWFSFASKRESSTPSLTHLKVIQHFVLKPLELDLSLQPSDIKPRMFLLVPRLLIPSRFWRSNCLRPTLISVNFILSLFCLALISRMGSWIF